MVKLYDFGCDTCSRTVAEWSKDPAKDRPNCCGKKMVRRFSVSVIVPSWMRAENLSGNERQKAFVDSPKARKMLDSGKYELGATRNRWNAD